MSKISLAPNISGSGTFTIAAPDSNTDRTLTLPDAAGTVFVSGQAVTATTGNFSGNVTLGSSVLETPTGSAPAYLCRAWVNFDGRSGASPVIQESGNVSSVVRTANGDYTVNFATAMPDVNYVATGSHSSAGSGFLSHMGMWRAGTDASQHLLETGTNSGTISPDTVSVAFFR